MTSPNIQALIERAKANHAARIAAQAAAAQATCIANSSATGAVAAAKESQIPKTSGAYSASGLLAPALQRLQRVNPAITFNDAQQQAIDYALQRKSFVLTGAAGTGKTTVTQAIIQLSESLPHCTPLPQSTKWLHSGAPGIAILGYTNKAVNNIKKRLPPHLQTQCLTIHKLVEYAPTYPEVTTPDGSLKTIMRFEPTYHALKKLPHIGIVIIEESSMVGTDLFGVLLAALPNPAQTQFIFLGDINQLKPVFGDSILGFKMVELPTVELTHVYRQALLSPIIALATDIRSGTNTVLARTLIDPVVLNGDEHGKVTIKPWKKRIAGEQALEQMKRFLPKLIDSGEYNPSADMILCPFNKSFGTIELNKLIAQHLTTERKDVTFEVIARYERSYWAVGDRVVHDRHECEITRISRNPKYAGKLPQPESYTLDRWGVDPNGEKALEDSDVFAQIDALALDKNEESFNQASHVITVWCPDLDKEMTLDTAGEINNMLLGYCLTVHKSQGSEWERVFIFTHNTHNMMINRELMYTAITRAKKELYIIVEGDDPKDGRKVNTLRKAQETHAIPGATLEDKIRYFTSKSNSYKQIEG